MPSPSAYEYAVRVWSPPLSTLDGFDREDGALGAAAALALIVVAGGVAMTNRRRPRFHPP